jgi:ligand-binding sensor domain-containing protein
MGHRPENLPSYAELTRVAGVLLSIAVIFTNCNEVTNPPPPSTSEQWVVYTKANSPLLGAAVYAIGVDGSNNKWFGCLTGAIRYGGGSWQSVKDDMKRYHPDTLNFKVTAITTSALDGSIWFGLAGGGVERFSRTAQGGQWATYMSPDLTSDQVYSLATDILGNVWVGTGTGVSRYIPGTTDPSVGTWLKYTSANSPIPDEEIKSVGFNPNDNTLWFGTYTQGVVSFDGDADWNIHSPSNAPFPVISAVFTMKNEGWFGTYGDWAYQFNVATDEWQRTGDLQHGGGLPSNIVNAVAVAADGTVWLGTDEGLAMYQGGKWSVFDTSNSKIPDNAIKALAIDKKGTLWIGTVNGVAGYTRPMW